MQRLGTGLIGLSLVLLQGSLPLVAGGRIPISEPTVITSPGSYVLTRNIDSDTGPAITVARNNVDIWLNGFTAKSTYRNAIEASAVTNLRVAGGRVAAVGDAVSVTGFSQNVVLEDLQIAVAGDGLRIEATNFRVSRVQIVPNPHLQTGIKILPGSSHGFVDHVSVSWAESYGFDIEGNHIAITDCSAGAAGDAGISIDGNDNVIARNSLFGSAVSIIVDGARNIVTSNQGTRTMVVAGGSTQVRENTITGADGHCISVRGSGNLLESNLASSCDLFGIFFSASAQDNVYRGNVARGNGDCTKEDCHSCNGIGTDDFCDEGTNNTSAGDNFLPDLR